MSDSKAPVLKNRGIKIIRRGLAALIILIIFFFLTKNLYQNWQKIIIYRWNINLWLLGLSFLFLLVGLIFLGYIWQRILKRLQVKISFTKAGQIWFLSGVARYLPGALWQIAGLAYLGQKQGISILKSTLSAALAQVLSIVAGVVVGSQILFFIPLPNRPVTFYILSALIVVLALVLLYPPLIRRVINFFMRKTSRPSIEFSFKFIDLLLFLVLYIAGWIIIGVAFAFFVRSFISTSWVTTAFLIAVFSASYIIGFLSILTPSGLGVREGAMVLLLNSFFALPVATVISFGARIWITIGELVCLTLFLILSKQRSHSEENLYSDDYYQRAVRAMERRNRFFRTRLHNIRALVSPHRGEHILDLGSGMGTVSLEFSKFGVRMTGVDLSQKAVNTAQRLTRNQHLTEIEFVRTNATRLPFRENTFDKIIAADLVEHLTEDETVLAFKESQSVLRPLGKLYIYTPSPTHLFEILKKRNILIKDDPSHVALKPVTFLKQALQSAELKSEKVFFAPSHLPIFQTFERIFLNLPFIGRLFRRRICIIAQKPNL